MRVRHQRLVRGGQRDAPGARLQLHFEQARGHGCLSVGRQPYSVSRDEILHPFQVVIKAVLVENGRWQAQVFTEQVPSRLASLVPVERHG